MRGKSRQELTTFSILEMASESLWYSLSEQVKKSLRNKGLVLVILFEIAYEKGLGLLQEASDCI